MKNLRDRHTGVARIGTLAAVAAYLRRIIPRLAVQLAREFPFLVLMVVSPHRYFAARCQCLSAKLMKHFQSYGVMSCTPERMW